MEMLLISASPLFSVLIGIIFCFVFGPYVWCLGGHTWEPESGVEVKPPVHGAPLILRTDGKCDKRLHLVRRQTLFTIHNA